LRLVQVDVLWVSANRSDDHVIAPGNSLLANGPRNRGQFVLSSSRVGKPDAATAPGAVAAGRLAVALALATIAVVLWLAIARRTPAVTTAKAPTAYAVWAFCRAYSAAVSFCGLGSLLRCVAGLIENGIGNYNVVTHNNLLGLQIGADMTFRKCRWEWGIESKIGPYLNYANQQSQINAARYSSGALQDTVDQRLVANRYEASLIGEVGFQASYKFRPNLVGRAAYDFMWVTGLALAPEQVQFVADPTDRVNVNGAIFSQGISLGLEWKW